jgi:hypothetical protein
VEKVHKRILQHRLIRKKKDLNGKFISAKIEHFGGSNPYKIRRKLNPNPEKNTDK